MQLTNLWFSVGKVLGVVPRNTKSTKKLVFFCFVIWTTDCFSTGTYFFIIREKFPATATLTDYALEILDCCAALGFTIISIRVTIKYHREWDKLINNDNKIDLLLSKEDNHCKESKFCITNIFEIMYHIALIYCLIRYPLSSIITITNLWPCAYFIICYQRFYLIFVLHKILTTTQEKCRNVHILMKQTFIYMSRSTINMDNQIMDLKLMIFLLNQNVQYVNLIFGYQILLILLGVFLQVVSAFDFIFIVLVNKFTFSYSSVLEAVKTFAFYFLMLPVSKSFFITFR